MLEVNDYSLRSHNTFGLDVRCERFIEYGDVGELRQILSGLRVRPSVRYLHIGAGSNLLFTRDFDGTVLHSAISGREVVASDADTVSVKVGAGEVWDDFVAWCVASGFYGAENLSLIPGEVGASAVQNIGAYGVEAKDLIERVDAVDVKTGEEIGFTGADCHYGYRLSRFKREDAGRYVITHVTYRLSRRFEPRLAYGALRRELDARGIAVSGLTASRLRDLIVDIRRHKLPDPALVGSAGSFFMNPVVSRDSFEQLQAIYPDMPHYDMEDGVKIPAGWMIEQCGWKGRALGPAAVYEKQALVLVNRGGATGEDVVKLSEAVCADVKARFGIILHPEVIFV